jgi:2-polyprenyl-3-methyl-5-hydroxy-6-metoxy-1,4-benzoquinol methylase
MDQPGLDTKTHHHALDGLKMANSVSRVSHIIWRGILNANVFPTEHRALRILDIASGGGDVIIGVSKLAARHGVELEAHGWDISPTAVAHAQTAADSAKVSCSFYVHNALIDDLPRDFDIILSTLFLHHLTNNDARDLLRRMAEAARHCVLIDDLCRNRLGYLYAWTGARLLTRSRIVHVDGPLSVRAAYTIAEFTQLARDAGMHDVKYRRHWPQRFLMTWKR